MAITNNTAPLLRPLRQSIIEHRRVDKYPPDQDGASIGLKRRGFSIEGSRRYGVPSVPADLISSSPVKVEYGSIHVDFDG